MFRLNVAILSISALAVVTPVQAQVFADSVAEFSSVQGQDGWFYGYYDRTNDVGGIYAPATDFQQMTQYGVSPDEWTVQEGTFWTRLGEQGGHDNGVITGGGRTEVEHWAIRRYVSEATGTVTLSGNLAKLNTGGGNGIVGRIFVDGTQAYSQTVNFNDAVGFNYSFDVAVGIGSTLDFILDPNASNDQFDGARFTAKLTAVPEPSALAAFVIGAVSGVVLLRRRRRKS